MSSSNSALTKLEPSSVDSAPPPVKKPIDHPPKRPEHRDQRLKIKKEPEAVSETSATPNEQRRVSDPNQAKQKIPVPKPVLDKPSENVPMVKKEKIDNLDFSQIVKLGSLVLRVSS